MFLKILSIHSLYMHESHLDFVSRGIFSWENKLEKLASSFGLASLQNPVIFYNRIKEKIINYAFKNVCEIVITKTLLIQF